jgi:chorismate synthase
MSGNTYGKIFTVSTFGESHGTAMGCIIDGCPPNIAISETDIQHDLDRRRPGQSDVTTQRNEDDKVKILSGVFEGKTTGTPIGLIIFNEDQRSHDYSNIKDVFRPNHADITYQGKYGIRDYRGGGRASARETSMRVAAGAVAKKVLEEKGITISSWVQQIGEIKAENFSNSSSNKYNFCDESKLPELDELFNQLIDDGDSVGAELGVKISGCKIGLGEPVFDKLDAELAKAIVSINAVKSVSFGNADLFLSKKGSEVRDEMNSDGYLSNNSGGILGGISSGQDIDLSFIIKPTSSIASKSKAVDVDGNEVSLEVKGRHDPCVAIRAVPIAEAMCALCVLDHYLRNDAQCSDVNQKLPFSS